MARGQHSRGSIVTVLWRKHTRAQLRDTCPFNLSLFFCFFFFTSCRPPSRVTTGREGGGLLSTVIVVIVAVAAVFLTSLRFVWSLSSLSLSLSLAVAVKALSSRPCLCLGFHVFLCCSRVLLLRRLVDRSQSGKQQREDGGRAVGEWCGGEGRGREGGGAKRRLLARVFSSYPLCRRGLSPLHRSIATCLSLLRMRQLGRPLPVECDAVAVLPST